MHLTHLARRTRPYAQRGFTYFMLLWWVALSGLVLAALSQQWRFERQREKEAEMVARAEEIRHALAAYHELTPGGQVGSWPSRLADLLEDRRGPAIRRHLRRLWVDPLTGKPEWGLVRESPTTPGIQGVYSLATARPIRAPAGISSYAEWRFEAGEAPGGP